MQRGDFLLFFLVFLYLSGAAFFDLRTGKIPNRYLIVWAAVFLIRAVFLGCVGQCLLETVVTAVILFPLFFFRMMGAGDVKLMALLGGVFGVREGFEVIFFGLSAAAVWSFFYMVRNGIFLKRIGYFLNYLKWMKQYLGYFSKDELPIPYYDAARDGREAAFCLAPFILLGYIVCLMAGM